MTTKVPAQTPVDITGDAPIDYTLTPAAYRLLAEPVEPVPSVPVPEIVAQLLAAVGEDQPPAVAEFLTGVVGRAAAAVPTLAPAFVDVLEAVQDELWGQALERSACLPGCASDDPRHETCEGPVVELPVPRGLDVREDQLLTARVVRLRDPHRGEDEVFVMSGGNGVGLSPSEAEAFADQLVSFAALMRRLARQASGSIPCNSCGGRGRWVETTHGQGGTVIQVERTCTTCGGSGKRG